MTGLINEFNNVFTDVGTAEPPKPRLEKELHELAQESEEEEKVEEEEKELSDEEDSTEPSTTRVKRARATWILPVEIGGAKKPVKYR